MGIGYMQEHRLQFIKYGMSTVPAPSNLILRFHQINHIHYDI